MSSLHLKLSVGQLLGRPSLSNYPSHRGTTMSSQHLRLECYDREKAMNFNLVDPTHSETVQLPMRLETGKYPLYASASVIDGLPFRILWIRLYGPFVGWMSLDNRRCVVLPPDQVPNPLTAIGSISNDILGMEPVVDPTSLVQEPWCHGHSHS
jgi:hypothetical protein